MIDSVLRIENLYFRYKNSDTDTLKKINFEVQQNEILVILGQSGCGKTTLFKNLLGLIEPYKGNIYINNKKLDIKDKENLKNYYKKIGVLFQSNALLNSLNIFENLKLPLDENTMLDENIKKIMIELKLKWVDLEKVNNLMPSELSGGMQKRAAIARSIILDPEIIFLDEPHSGLDPLIIAEVNDLMIRINKAFKMSVVVITHDVNSAFALADKILLLNKGEIHFYGNKDEFSEVIKEDEYINDFVTISNKYSKLANI
jgi:phospholipid/cholesterol/gamma-HCH transport system ATP-binding protein